MWIDIAAAAAPRLLFFFFLTTVLIFFVALMVDYFKLVAGWQLLLCILPVGLSIRVLSSPFSIGPSEMGSLRAWVRTTPGSTNGIVMNLPLFLKE